MRAEQSVTYKFILALPGKDDRKRSNLSLRHQLEALCFDDVCVWGAGATRLARVTWRSLPAEVTLPDMVTDIYKEGPNEAA